MLSPDQKQRLLDAVRDFGIDELPEAAGLLIQHGEELQVQRGTSVGRCGATRLDADVIKVENGHLVLEKGHNVVAVFTRGQWDQARRVGERVELTWSSY